MFGALKLIVPRQPTVADVLRNYLDHSSTGCHRHVRNPARTTYKHRRCSRARRLTLPQLCAGEDERSLVPDLNGHNGPHDPTPALRGRQFPLQPAAASGAPAAERLRASATAGIPGAPDRTGRADRGPDHAVLPGHAAGPAPLVRSRGELEAAL